METISKRIDAVNNVGEEYRKEVIPAPPSVKIEMTSRCNFYCGFCSHRKNFKKYADIDKDFYKRVVKEMREAGVEELGMFYIGESLMLPWLAEAIKYAKDIGFPYVFLTTNGSLASRDKLKSLMEAGLDSLKFSFNNADPFQFRQVTGMAPSVFNLIVKNIKTARELINEYGFKTKIYASSIKYTGKQQESMEKAVNEIKPYLYEHYWLPLLSFGAQAVDSEKELGMEDAVKGNPGRLDNMRDPLPCWAVFKEGHITSEGKLSACCFDNSDKWIMADLNDKSFMDGWNSEEFQNLRKAHLKGDVHGTACEQCIYPV